MKFNTLSEKLSRLLLGTAVCLGLVFSPGSYAQSSSNSWVELGECVVDYTSWLPDWIEGWVDDVISGEWSNGLEAEHPDAYLKVFADSSEEQQIGSTIYRGFYAEGNEAEDWIEKLTAWADNKRVVYVTGVVKDKESRNNCSLVHRNFEFGSWGFFTTAGSAKSRFDTGRSYEPDYHLFKRNCQHFTKWVLTGVDGGQ